MFGNLLKTFSNGISAAVSGFSPTDSRLISMLHGTSSITSAGVRVDHDTILGLPAIMRGTDIISSSAANVPFYVYKRTSDKIGSREREYDPTHPAWRKICPPEWGGSISRDKEFGVDTFVETMIHNAILWGNAVAVIDRPNWPDSIAHITPLMPDRTYPVRIDDDMVERMNVDEDLRGKLYYVTVIGDQEYAFEASECIHIKRPGENPYWGPDIVEVLAEALGVPLAAQRYGSNFYGSGSLSKGFVEIPAGMSPEAEERFIQSVENVKGLDSAHSLVALEEGAKFVPWQSDPEKAQFIEGREFDIRILAQAIGIKPHKLIDANGTSYNSLTESNKEHKDDDVWPWVRRLRTEFNLKLLTIPQRNRMTHSIDVDEDALDYHTLDEMAESMKKFKEAGIMNRDEIRDRLKMPRSKGKNGKRFVMPANFVFEDQADDIVDAKINPPQPAPQPAPVEKPEEPEKKDVGIEIDITDEYGRALSVKDIVEMNKRFRAELDRKDREAAIASGDTGMPHLPGHMTNKDGALQGTGFPPTPLGFLQNTSDEVVQVTLEPGAEIGFVQASNKPHTFQEADKAIITKDLAKYIWQVGKAEASGRREEWISKFDPTFGIADLDAHTAGVVVSARIKFKEHVTNLSLSGSEEVTEELNNFVSSLE